MVFVSKEKMGFLALQGRKLGKSGYLAFFMLHCAVDSKNRVVVDWKSLAGGIGVSLAAARKAVSVLVELGVMAERSGAGMYQFNPAYVWGGDPDDHEQALEDWHRRERIKLVPEVVPEFTAKDGKSKSKATKKKSHPGE